MKLIFIVMLVFIVVACTKHQLPTEIRKLEIDGHQVIAEVVTDLEDQQRGLKYRKNLAENNGMLFIFPRSENVCMWMKDTIIPLTVAFLNEHRKIINFVNMEPKTETRHCSAQPAKFALEIEHGWFAVRDIKPGTIVSWKEI